MSQRPCSLFISYAHADEHYRQLLVKALSPLRREGLITEWADTEIPAGQDFNREIDSHLRTADIILLLVSADFLASEYCYAIEMTQALERHRRREAVVIPVIVRSVDWQASPFAGLKALPKDGKPIVSSHWHDVDEALTDTTKGIRRAILTLHSRSRLQRSADSAQPEPERGVPVAGGETIPTTSTAGNTQTDVAELYTLLGYRCFRDTAVFSEPSDMICELSVRGTPSVRWVVRCVMEGSEETISSAHRELVERFEIVGRSEGLMGAVLVHDIPGFVVTPAHLACRVLSYRELVAELLNASVSLRKFVSAYERQEIFLSYVPLRCMSLPQAIDRDQDVNDSVDQEAPTNAEHMIAQWLGGQSSLLIVLGDFGTGKTTLVERVKYSLAGRYLSSTGRKVPMYLSLRNFDSIGAIDRFVEQGVEDELGLKLPFGRFLELLKQGDVLLILDGFDEMGPQIDRFKRRSHFQTLLPLLFASSKTIITCRPAYFVTDAELRAVLSLFADYSPGPLRSGMRPSLRSSLDEFVSSVQGWIEKDTGQSGNVKDVARLELCPLSSEDIDRYISALDRSILPAWLNPDELRRRIRNTYDLEDLAKRPLLLNMIARTLPSLPSDQEASPSVIYDAYTNGWLSHDYAKGEARLLVPASEKRGFMQILAWQMYISGKVAMPHSEMQPHLTAFFNAEGAARDFIATHIQACSFLSRDQDGVFIFSHKSFLEYFAADYVKAQIEDGGASILGKAVLSEAVLFFLGDMIHANSRLAALCQPHIRSAFSSRSAMDSIARENWVRMAAAARCPIPAISIVGEAFRDVRFKRNQLSGDVSNAEWTSVGFERCRFEGLRVDGLSVGEAEAVNCRFESVWLRNISLKTRKPQDAQGLSLKGCVVHGGEWSGATAITAEQSNITNAYIAVTDGHLAFAKCDVKDVDLIQSRCQLLLSATTFSSGVVAGCDVLEESSSGVARSVLDIWGLSGTSATGGSDVKTWHVKNVTFRDTLLLWCDFTQIDIDRATFVNCVFLGCRFQEPEELRAMSARCDASCRFVGLCVRSLGAVRELKGSRIRRDEETIPLLEELAQGVSERGRVRGRSRERGGGPEVFADWKRSLHVTSSDWRTFASLTTRTGIRAVAGTASPPRSAAALSRTFRVIDE